MTPEDYQRATELFAKATELPQSSRDAWLAEQCEDNSELLRTVRSMLQQDAEFDHDLDSGFQFVPKIELPDSLNGLVNDNQDTEQEKKKILGQYELIEEVGQGSMGVVFKARQRQPDRLVALKTIRAGRLASDADIKRFVNESQAAAKLNHDGIVPVYEVGCENGAHFFSMQFIDGKSLEDLVKENKTDKMELVKLLADICDAVSYCHQNGIVHRDLKPSNILIDSHGHAKVTDFGLARNLQHDSTLTATGDVMGTPGYMPPEQALGLTTDTKPNADVYSLGAILYHILTGRPPILARNVNLVGAIQMIRDHDVVAAKYFDRKIARDLDTICSKCLEKDPAKRYQNAGELAADLRSFFEGEPIQARGLNWYHRTFRWARQQPGLAVSWAAISMIFLWHVTHFYLLSAGTIAWSVHLNSILIAATWATGAWAFQRSLMFYGGRSLILFAWASMDVVLLSLLLIVQGLDGANSYVTFLFFPIVAVAALRMRMDLLVYITLLSICAYWLQVCRNNWNPEDELTDIPYANAVMFSLSLLTLGLVQYFTLRRSRFAIESFTKRPPDF